MPQIKVFILEIVKENPFLTLIEIAYLVSINFDIVLSQMTIHNVLKQNKITHKRRKLRYFPPDQKISKAQELKQFYKNLDKIDKKIIFTNKRKAIDLEIKVNKLGTDWIHIGDFLFYFKNKSDGSKVLYITAEQYNILLGLNNNKE